MFNKGPLGENKQILRNGEGMYDLAFLLEVTKAQLKFILGSIRDAQIEKAEDGVKDLLEIFDSEDFTADLLSSLGQK